MKVERISDVVRRANLYAALGDPTRLKIVDILTLGDAASSELSQQLRVASNLLAHHLKILQETGLVASHRSEGDARRSYWRLVPHAFEPLVAPTLAIPERVVFVCTANTARSQLAAAAWREASSLPATSAGTHPAEQIDPAAVAAARRHDLDLPEVRPRHLDDVVADGDLVVTVCDLAHEELGEVAPLHWSVPDPVGHGTAAFDRAFAELTTRVRLLAPLLAHAS